MIKIKQGEFLCFMILSAKFKKYTFANLSFVYRYQQKTGEIYVKKLNNLADNGKKL